jgi:GNAT superfamily N-acetyltransferase
MTWICRPATAADAGDLAVMVTALAALHGDRATVTPEALRAYGFGPRPRFHAIVAEGPDGLIGYAICYIIFNAQTASVVADLHHLYVVADHRQAGVGRALVAGVVDWAEAEGCHRLRVGVAPDNRRAADFYRRLGMREKAPNFLADQGDFPRLRSHCRQG